MRGNTLYQALAASLCAAAISLTLHASEKVYKWVDAEGVVHYGQQPPAETKSEAISVQKGYSKPADEPEELSDKEKEARQAAEFCSTATKNLEVLANEGEIRQADEYGEVRTLSEEQKAEQKERAKAAVDRYCKPDAATTQP